jgi:hypothetical protein
MQGIIAIYGAAPGWQPNNDSGNEDEAQKWWCTDVQQI